MLHVLGIRHHGPGSAKSLQRALAQLQPDCLLIEAPADAEKMLSMATTEYLILPVALLIYNPKDFKQAVFLPFALFSPEWIAIQFALEHNIPIRFMDLPMAIKFGLPTGSNNFEITEEKQAIVADPLGYLARLAGYEDSERWWEVMFEQQVGDVTHFEAVLSLMTALRNEVGAFETEETLLREAYMRKTAHQATKDGFQTIAIVCGAWHSPIFQNFDTYRPKQDNTLLKGLSKVKTEATWIPWAYTRLASSGGYRAGVISPAWYEIIFQHSNAETIRWMVQAARLLRAEDLEASTANALDAVRLADTLATIRAMALPGLDELREAAITVLCNGDKEPFELIEEKLVIGTAVGKVAQDVKSVPLQKDLIEQIKSANLKKYWENTESQWLKASAQLPKGGIDLREPNDLLKSRLLHRLNILNVAWGTRHHEGRQDKGSFKEYWKMAWMPELAIHVIEASRWGNTVEDAANTCMLEKTNNALQLVEIVALLEQAMLADIQEATTMLLTKLQESTAHSQDVFRLIAVFATSARIVRYGSVRATNVVLVQSLIEQLLVRITVALPAACVNLDDTFAKEASEQIRQFHDAIHVMQEAEYESLWYDTLTKIESIAKVHPRVEGYAIRLLLDKQVVDPEWVEKRMQFTFSKGNTPLQAAMWLEGFLEGSGLILIYHQSLWQLLHSWLGHLEESTFLEVVPMLRRAFSTFTPPERQKILAFAKGNVPEKVEQQTMNQHFELVAETVSLLLGW